MKDQLTAPKKTAAPKKVAAPKKTTAQQSAGDISKQGATSAATEFRGGAKQVLITEAVMTGRTGRPAGVEDYPFGELAPATKDKDGKITGQSFFIPLDDRAEGRLAAARKRHKEADGSPALFWSRKRSEQINGNGPEVEGLRIWRGTPELKDIAKR